jgi:predicted ATPase/DNA-binding SARP family transcriptional activator
MEIQILGPLRVFAAGEAVELSAALERALLLRLLLDANRPVSLAQLVEDLWAGRPPRTAVRTMRVYVSRLRQGLGEVDRITTTADGYLLRVEPGECDAQRFETLAAAGEFAAALTLWRGAALAEVANTEWARIEASRLEESRLAVLERRLGQDLAAGRHLSVVAELDALCAREPLREGLWASLMLALYRCGRPADALATYRRLRSHLVGELGLEPSPALRLLQDRILAADPGLDVVSPTTPTQPLGTQPQRTQPAAGTHPAGTQPTGTQPTETQPTGAHPAGIPPAAPPRLPQRGNVSAARTSFISGTLDVATVRERLADGHPVTLVGPPGAGKTRLAVELAVAAKADYPAGAWLIELAAVTDGELLPDRVADALGPALAAAPTNPTTPTTNPATKSSTNGSGATARLIDHFSAQPGLLVLDNCEHLTGACTELVDQLAGACPKLALLCTSRERLDVEAETVCRVPLLAVPLADASPEQIFDAAACRLFVDRAAVAGGRPDLDDPEIAEAVAEICRRLDGLPLALELAAARTGVMSPVDIAARLDDGLELLQTHRGRVAPRQRTLRALLEWSHSMLDDDERRLLRRLAVFAGGATLDAVEQVCAPPQSPRGSCLDALEGLVERSLVVADTVHGRARYRLLETIRLYALEQLRDAREENLLRARHTDWCTSFATDAQRQWLAGNQQQAAQHVAEEQDNWRAALRWLITRGDGERAVALAAPLGQWWYANGRTREGRAMLEAVLALSGPPSRERATVLRFAGALARTAGDLPLARRFIADGIAVAEAVGDRSTLLQLQISLGAVTWLSGDSDAAATILAQALDTAVTLGDRRAEGNLSYNLAVLARNAGELEEALARITTAAAAWSDAADPRGLALARGLAASVQLRRGELEEARGLLAEALGMLAGTEFAEAIVEQLETAVTLYTREGQYPRAAQLLGQADAVRRAEQLIRPPFDEAEAHQLLATIREQIGSRTDAELAAGSQISLEAAITLALSGLSRPAHASQRTP